MSKYRCETGGVPLGPLGRFSAIACFSVLVLKLFCAFDYLGLWLLKVELPVAIKDAHFAIRSKRHWLTICAERLATVWFGL